MTSMPAVHPARYASPMEAGVHGVHVARTPTSRFTAPVDTRWTTPGRLHLYAGWAYPGAHRAAIVRSLLRLEEHVSIAYVDVLRDARGWAFREASGADPVNGFTLLREAYEWTQPGYDGPVTVPVLWDRHESRILSNDPDGIDRGLATAFAGRAGHDLYPDRTRIEIDQHNRWIERAITSRLGPSVYDEQSRTELLTTFGELNARFAGRRYLAGDALTLADVRLWVSLVRYDAGPNAHGAVGPSLAAYEHLWTYATRLYLLPAFRDSTRFSAIAAPYASLPPWPALSSVS